MEISNPFITSSWVRGEDFFGREETLEHTREFLRDPGKTILLVYGQRRMGKTSLLKRIQVDDQVLQSACPVFYNLQDKPFTPLPLLLAEIAQQIIIDLDLKMTGKAEDFNASSFEKEFLPALVPHLQENKYLLLVFDEADVMETVHDTLENSPARPTVSGENTPAYRHFIPFLENLAREIQRQKYPVKLILAVGRDFKPYRENQFDAIAKLDSSSQLELAVLTKVETENLLNRLTASSIPFEPGAVDEVYALTSGHPYFTQCLAKAAFDAAEKEKKNRVTAVMVRQQFIPTLKKYSGNIYSVWDSFSPKDQIVLYLMAVGKEDHQPVTQETLQQKASLLNVLPALENLPQTLERLKTIGFIEEHRQGDKETQYDFQVEFLRKWVTVQVSLENIFEKKKQLEQHRGVTRQKGVLLLADIVDFTPQAERQGPGNTRQFEQTFESAVKTMAPTYKGDYIKRIGDAVLLFFADETDALDFALRLREASRQRELDRGDFVCSLRIVAHFGKFDFQYSQGFLVDVTGADAIVVFRLEKRAQKHEILVTQFLLQLIEGDLKDKGLQVVKLPDEPLKGLQRPIAVYRLKFPSKEVITVSTNPLLEKMGELERDTREIPVFGKIYPAMSMRDNFVNLDISADEETAAREREEKEKEWREFKESFELREHKHIQEVRLPLKVSELYERYKRGIIFGLPGSGKTTILKYFAYREFQKNALTQDPAKTRIVLFIPCRPLVSYVDWHRRQPGTGTGEETGLEYSIESILGYLAHSFLVTWQAPGVQAAGLTAQRAYYQGRLTLLIDALDEAPDREVKENIIAILKELFFHSQEGKRYGNRFYLTARCPERERFPAKDAAALKPVFDVRSLDTEQLRQMAEYFYRDNRALYKEFDRVVWQEEIAAKVGGTPLTALLVIAYFECFKKFDTRFHMYHVLLVFILIRAWKEIKEGVFNKDMKTFFEEARSLVILEEKPYLTAGKIYDALTLLAYGYIGEPGGITEEDLLENFILFAREKEKPAEAGKEAHRWMNRLKEDQLLVPAGLSRYVFIHHTVMEYLAARYLVEKVNDPGYLLDKFPIKDIAAALEKVDSVFFQGETLPIAVGSGIREGAHILRILEKLIAKAKDRERQNLLHLTALQSLAEWESYIDRGYRRQHLEYLHLDREKQINGNWDAVDWVYRYLLGLLLTDDKNKLKTTGEAFKNISKLSRPYFLEKYMTEEAYRKGDSEMMALRKELLERIIKQEPLDRWLGRHRVEKEPGIEVGAGVLTMDSAGYHPGDKNFKYYREYTGKGLIGFLGSPNLKHSGGVNCAAVSPDGRYIISGSDDHTLKLWDLETGKEIRAFKGHSSAVMSVAFSPQGNVILSGSYDNTLKLWDLETGKEIRAFKGHSDTVRSVAFSPLGNVILSGSDDNTLKLWDLETGKEIRAFKGHSSAVSSVAFSPLGNVILSGSSDHTLKLWDLETGQCIQTIPLPWIPLEIKPAPLQPGLFATANANGTVTLFDFNEITGKG